MSSSAVTRRKYSQENRCVRCGSIETNGKAMCALHLEEARVASQRFAQKNRQQGLCRCGNLLLSKGRYCEKCWFQNIAKLRTGTTANGTMIKTLLEKQGYLCAYTGEVLTIELLFLAAVQKTTWPIFNGFARK